MERMLAIKVEERIMEVLSGRMNLLLTQSDREALAGEAIEKLLRDGEFAEVKTELEDPDKKREFIQNFLSYGILTQILCDLNVEDVIINNIKPIYVHHSQKGFICTGVKFANQKELDHFVQKLLFFSGRTKLNKIVNIELPNLEGRVNIALAPFGPQITITKAKVTPLSIIDLIRNGSMTHELAAQLWMYLEGMAIRPANLMLAGGPGVGKTTMLNALLAFIPDSDRIVVIEDTLELNTFLEESCSRLESDEDLTLADLVKNSLRMRPERIIIGEVRGAEARDMITACNIGKYCMGTIHALTSREAIIRLQNEPMNIPEMLVNLIDVFVVLKRYHVGGKVFRVVDEVSETSGMEQVKILLAPVYKYDYDTKKQKQVNPSTVFRDKLSSQSGLIPKEVIGEHMIRSYLLRKLDEKGMSTMKEVATFCRAYAHDKDKASMNVGLDRQELLKKIQI
jgi:flagellar protein FlaI